MEEKREGNRNRNRRKSRKRRRRERKRKRYGGREEEQEKREEGVRARVVVGRVRRAAVEGGEKGGWNMGKRRK